MAPELETERVRMRAWQNADFEPFAAFCSDEESARFIGGVCPRDDAWRRIAAIVGHWALRGYGFWALEDKASGRFAGYAGLWFPEGWPEPEVGWGLLREFQGRGLVTEAAERARAFAYEELGWPTAISCIANENVASIRVAERLGAQREKQIELRGWEVAIYRHPSPSQLID